MTLTPDDIQRAKQVPILDLVRAAGLTPIRKGPNWTTREHDSLILFTANANRWWQFSQGIGGDSIEWVRHTKHVSFEEAVAWLINRSPETRLVLPAVPAPPPPPPLDQNLGQRFHDNMGPRDREWWLERGVPIAIQDRFHLGVCHHRVYGLCYSLPVYEDYRLVNIRLRLAQPVDPKDRYRPYDANRGTQLWAVDEIVRTSPKGLVVVAGEIKAAVLWGYDIPTVSPTAGCGHWRPEWTARLKDVRRIYVAYDPGEEAAGARLAEEIGPRARLAILPDKPDDLVNQKGVAALRYHLRHAQTVQAWRKERRVELPDVVTDALYDSGPASPPDLPTDVPWQDQLLP